MADVAPLLIKVALDISQPVQSLAQFQQRILSAVAATASGATAAGASLQEKAQALGVTQANLIGQANLLQQQGVFSPSENVAARKLAVDTIASAAAEEARQMQLSVTLTKDFNRQIAAATLGFGSGKTIGGVNIGQAGIGLIGPNGGQLGGLTQSINIEAMKKSLNAAIQAGAFRDPSYIAANAAKDAARQAAQDQSRILGAPTRIIARGAISDAQLAATAPYMNEGTWFQRWAARVQHSSPGVQSGAVVPLRPTEERTAGQAVGAGLFRSAGYLASGALIFGGISAIRTSIKDAAELEKQFTLIRSQFEGLGKSNAADSFIANIKSISKETGQAATDVAKVAFQFVGAFGDANKAIEETRSASELSRLTDLPIKEITDSLTALITSFKGTGLSIRDVGDVSLGLQERFGVLAKETITFAADLAPVAAQAGFTASQLLTLGAVAQKYSGQTGSSLAEHYARILPELTTQSVELVKLFQSNPLLSGKQAVDLGKAFGAGDSAKAFDILGQSYDKLTQAQQNYVIQIVGQRRDAQALIPVLEHYNEITNANADASTFAGKQAEYFSKLQATLSQSMARIVAQLKLLGVSIVQSGLADFLKTIITIGGAAVAVLSGLVNAFAEINKVLGGVPAKVLGVATAIIALTAAMRALAATRTAGGIGSLLSFGSNALFGVEAAAGARALTGTVAAGSAAEGVAATGGAGALGVLGGPIGIAAIATLVGSQYISSWSKGFTEGAKKKIDQDIAAAGEDTAKQLKIITDAAHASTNYEDQFSGPAFGAAFHELFGIGSNSKEDAVKYANEKYNALQGKAEAEKVRKAVEQGLLTNGAKSIFDGKETQYSQGEALTGETDIEKQKASLLKYADDLEAGRENALAAKELLDLYATNNPALKKFLEGFVASADAAAKTAEDAQAVQESADAAKKSYDAGKIGLGTYLDAIQKGVDAINLIRAGGTLAPEIQDIADALDAQNADAITGAVKAQIDNQKTTRDLLGHGSAEADLKDLQSQYSYLKQQKAAGLAINPEEFRRVRIQILQALAAYKQQQINDAKDAVSKAAAQAEGLNIDQYAGDIRLDDLKDQIANSNVKFQLFLHSIGEGAIAQDDSLVTEVAKQMLELGKSFRAALIAVLDARVGSLTKIINLIAPKGTLGFGLLDKTILDPLKKQKDDLYKVLFAEITGSGDQSGDPTALGDTLNAKDTVANDIKDKVDAEAKKAREARDRYEEAKAGDNPLAVAQLHQAQADRAAKEATTESERIDAQTDRLKADKEYKDAISSIYDSYTDSLIGAANRAGDFVTAAKLAVEKAQAGLARAKDTGNQAAINSATETLNQTMEDLRIAQIDQINDVLSAQNELAQAMAEAAGNTLEAVKIAQQEAEAQYNAAVQKHGATSKEAVSAQAAAVRAAAQVRDEQLSEDEENIQFALDMEEVTKDQAIEQFKALLSLPGLTQEQTRSLRRKIKELQDSSSQDLQLDLPTDIALPTLYQVARYNTGYADNRVIQFNIQVNNGVDANNLINNISGQVNGPPRFGTSGTVY